VIRLTKEPDEIEQSLRLSRLTQTETAMDRIEDPRELEREIEQANRLASRTCAFRKLNPGISVMESAQDWATKNVPGAIDGARDRRIFLQG
jgi:hypothetical protein